ncbi:MAG: sodium:solute symporter [Ignavibacteriales bacterium]|nr:sodium:solute symporter [Ignavibacteriales bacterium]
MNAIASKEMVFASWILVIIYALVILYFVVRGALKTKSISDYAVGTFQFSPIAVGLSLAASMTSAATFVINPGFIAYYGFSAVVSFGLVLPIASLISLVVLTKSFRKHGTSVKALTLSQWMGSRYNSRSYAVFFAILSLLLITFIVLINVGLTNVLSKALNVNPVNVLMVISIFVFGYMMFGGANSMVYTNAVQASIMIIVAIIMLGSGSEFLSDGISGLVDRLKAIDPKLVQLTNESSFLFRDYFEIFITQIIIGVAIICQPHIITKSLLLKTDKQVNKYLLTAVVIQFLFFIVVITGLWARLTFPDLTLNGTPLKVDQIISAYVVKKFSWFIGLIVVMGLLSAGISTIEGLIQSISTTITSDLIKPLIEKFNKNKNELNDRKYILINRVVIIVIGFVSYLLSYDQLINPKLSVGIFAQNGVYAFFSSAFVPISFGMFFKNIKKHTVITASVTAIVVHFILYYGQIRIPFTQATGENPGVAAAMAIVASVIVAGVLHLISRGKNENQ